MYMRVTLVGRDFDFSANDGISRYSAEIYKGVRGKAITRLIATYKLPKIVRPFYPAIITGSDIVHLMYPDVLRVRKGKARMLTMWHDLRLLSKYRSGSQQRYKPRFTESFNIAAGMVKRIATGNYADTDTNICNSSQTLKELKSSMKQYCVYDASKRNVIIPLGVDEAYLRTRVWRGERSDFVYLGTIHLRHKNLEGLLRVFDKVAAERKSRLHIFTSSPDAQPVLASVMQGLKHVSDRNVLLHYRADDNTVAEYMSRAAAYLHLSTYEGQGLPILNAMASGTNTLVLKDATIPEETSRYAFKGTEEEIVEKAIALSSDPRPASKRAIGYARGFTWQRMVRRTFAEYKRLL